MAELWVWLTVGLKSCPDCGGRHGAEMSLAEWEMIGLPGDGMTICTDYCRCLVMRTGFLEEIGGGLGLEWETNEELLEGLGFARPIYVISRALQDAFLLNPELTHLGFADMDYEMARAEMIELIRAKGGDFVALEVRGLYELIELYESLP